MGQLAEEARRAGAGVTPSLAQQAGQSASRRLHTSECTGGLITPPLGAQFRNQTAGKQNPKPTSMLSFGLEAIFPGHRPVRRPWTSRICLRWTSHLAPSLLQPTLLSPLLQRPQAISR